MYSFSVVVGIIALWAVWYLQALATNYRSARRTGFPIYASPVNHGNLFWLIFSVPLRPLFARLPAFAFDRRNLWLGSLTYELGPGDIGLNVSPSHSTEERTVDCRRGDCPDCTFA